MKFITALKLYKRNSSDSSDGNLVTIVSSVNSNNLAIYLNAYSNQANSCITFKESKLLLNESFTALDFSIETVDTLSIAFENSKFETTNLFKFSFGTTL